MWDRHRARRQNLVGCPRLTSPPSAEHRGHWVACLSQGTPLFQRLELQGLLSILAPPYGGAILASPPTLSTHICSKQIPYLRLSRHLAGTTPTNSTRGCACRHVHCGSRLQQADNSIFIFTRSNGPVKKLTATLSRQYRFRWHSAWYSRASIDVGAGTISSPSTSSSPTGLIDQRLSVLQATISRAGCNRFYSSFSGRNALWTTSTCTSFGF